MVKRYKKIKNPNKKQKSEDYINNLPNEILNQIFLYLSGNDLRRSMFVCNKWNLIITNTFLNNDCVIVMDTTNSVNIYWNDLYQVLLEKLNSYDKYRFGFVVYNDHYKDNKVIDYHRLTYKTKNLIDFIDNVEFGIGDDLPEAVLDGLYIASNFNWNINNINKIILITDSPPHGKLYMNSDNSYRDNYPDGCPCGLTEKYIFNQLKLKNINLYILYTDNDTKLMCDIFTKFLPNTKSYNIIPYYYHSINGFIESILSN